MPGPSVQLFQSASGTVNSSGNVTLTFPVPMVNRVWQGTVTLVNVFQGQMFTVLLGGLNFASMYAPGPAGPFQILSGQQLSLTASGMSSGTQVTAVLSGVDDPADNSTPYTGSSVPPTIYTGSSTLVTFSSITGANSSTPAYNTTYTNSGATGPITAIFQPVSLFANQIRIAFNSNTSNGTIQVVVVLENIGKEVFNLSGQIVINEILSVAADTATSVKILVYGTGTAIGDISFQPLSVEYM